MPSFATQNGFSGHQERPRALGTSFLNRASQVRVLPGAPGIWFAIKRGAAGSALRGSQHQWMGIITLLLVAMSSEGDQRFESSLPHHAKPSWIHTRVSADAPR